MRWFWWRINAVSEIVAMVSSLTISVTVTFVLPQMAPEFMKYTSSWVFLLAGTAITTLAWIVATLVTKPTDKERLYSFYKLVQPGGPGWKKIVDQAKVEGVDLEVGRAGWDVPAGILCTILASIGVYTSLFSSGAFIYGNTMQGVIYGAVCVVSFILMAIIWTRKLSTK